jgi:hypothetical protein
MMPRVLVTLFDDFGARQKREEVLSPYELADLIRETTAPEKSALPWLKMARFGDIRTEKGSLRHDSNLESIFGIEADYDGGVIPLETVLEAVRGAGVTAVVYTSPSFTPDNPRWRVLCPTSEDLPPAMRGKLLDRLNGVLGGCLAGESWTLSQSYYFGSVANNPDHRVEVIEGRPINELVDLDAGAIGKNGRNGKESGSSTKDGHDYQRNGDSDDALLEQIKTGETYHNAAMRLLGRWSRQGVPMIEAERRLREAFDCVFPPDRDQRWQERVRQIPEWLVFVYGKDAGKAAGESAGPSADLLQCLIRSRSARPHRG